MRAIDVIDQMRELVVSNRVLVILEDVPFWLAPENTEIVSCMRETRQDRQPEQGGDNEPFHVHNQASLLDFAAINRKIGKC